MGKRNTSRWTDMHRPLAPEPFQFGFYRVDGDSIREWLCTNCAQQRGISEEAPSWKPCLDVPELARYEDCGTCGVRFRTLLPMRCPRCGNDKCFAALALSWVHVGPMWKPHSGPELAEQWDDLDYGRVECTACDFSGDVEDFWPAWPDHAPPPGQP